MRDRPVVIETDRLILRPHRKSDFEDVHALWADPSVVRHIFDRPQTEGEAWLRLMRYCGHWALLSYGYWAVEDCNSGRFMGEVGFADYRREIEPSLARLPEAGWVMARHAHGQGLAEEAMRAALRWCDEHVEAKGIWAMITPENAGSLRLAEKLGLRQTRVGAYNGQSRLIYERRRGG